MVTPSLSLHKNLLQIKPSVELQALEKEPLGYYQGIGYICYGYQGTGIYLNILVIKSVHYVTVYWR